MTADLGSFLRRPKSVLLQKHINIHANITVDRNNHG